MSRPHRSSSAARCWVTLALATFAAWSNASERFLFIGQDLDSIEGYIESRCCAAPDGLTAYVSLYNVLSAEASFGGLGIDPNGAPVSTRADWGAGPKNAFETATRFGVTHQAMGLSITENDHPGALDELLIGRYDAEIQQIAVFSEYVPGTLFLRIGYEFDGAWNAGYENPSRYVAAFQYIVTRLREHEASNIVYVWQGSASTTDDMIDGHHEDITAWYPGDAYVDWLAFSWFMAPHARPVVDRYRPPTPIALAREIVEFANERMKPVMIAEAAPQAFDLALGTKRNHSALWDGDEGGGTTTISANDVWRRWFAPLFRLMTDNESIQALAYINANWDVQPMWAPPYESGYWGDSRLETSPTIAERFSAAVEQWREHAR